MFSALKLKRLLPEIIISEERVTNIVFLLNVGRGSMFLWTIYNIRDRAQRVLCLYIFVSSILPQGINESQINVLCKLTEVSVDRSYDNNIYLFTLQNNRDDLQ